MENTKCYQNIIDGYHFMSLLLHQLMKMRH
nr:MAG TPA: hypothetical protein [Caudoviricetes sp.]